MNTQEIIANAICEKLGDRFRVIIVSDFLGGNDHHVAIRGPYGEHSVREPINSKFILCQVNNRNLVFDLADPTSIPKLVDAYKYCVGSNNPCNECVARYL